MSFRYVNVASGLFGALLPWEALIACTLCGNAPAQAVRAQLFDGAFLGNGVAVATPLVILAAIVAWIGHEPRSRHDPTI